MAEAAAASERDDFGSFVQLLATTVIFVLDWTLNALCGLLALVAMLVPWRLAAVVIGSCRFDMAPITRTHWDFRNWCVKQLGFSVLDLILLAFGLPIMWWPGKYRFLYKKLEEQRSETMNWRVTHYNFAIREAIIAWEAFTVLELFSLPFHATAIVCPWRTATYLHEIREHWESWLTDPDSTMFAIHGTGIFEGFMALFDAPFFFWALPWALVPSRLLPFFRISFSKKYWDDEPATCLFWSVWLTAPLLSIIDIASSVCALLAVISPLRTRRFMENMREDWNGQGFSDYFQACQFNPTLRKHCIVFGLLSLFDILLLPLSAIIFFTVYRAQPLLRALGIGSTDSVPDNRVALLGCACCPVDPEDGRGQPSTEVVDGDGDDAAAAVRRAREQQPLFPSRYQREVLWQSLLASLDLLTLPFLFLVGLTQYRWRAMRQDIASARKSRFAYHRVCLEHGLIVVHDFLMLTCVIFPLISGYRANTVFQLLWAQEDGFRQKFWNQILQLILDIPMLPLVFLLLATLWRADLVVRDLVTADDDCSRRRRVVDEFVMLLRDCFGFIAAAIVVVTMVRCPRIVLELWAHCSRAADGSPRMWVSSVSILYPRNDNGVADKRGVLCLKMEQEEARDRRDIGSIFLNVRSASFWDEVDRLFGSSIASLGRGLMPFRLKDGQHFDFAEVCDEKGRIRLKMGGNTLKQKLMLMSPDLYVCVQLEHEARNGGREVLCRFPLLVRSAHEAIATPDTAVEIPADALAPGAEEQFCGPPVRALGLRGALWFCAFTQLWQLLLDVLHILMFLLCLLAPWEFAGLLHCLTASTALWTALLAEKALSYTHYRGAGLERYRHALEPVLNAVAKERQKADSHWLHFDSKTVAEAAKQQLSEYALAPQKVITSVTSALSELRSSSSTAGEFADMLQDHTRLQEAAAAHWPSLAFYVNMHFTMEMLDPMEHAEALRCIEVGAARADELLAESSHKLSEKQRQLSKEAAEAKGSRCRNFLAKSTAEYRDLVRIFAVKTVTDWGFISMLLLLFVTFYRVPALVRDFQRSKRTQFEDRLKMAIAHQVWLLCRDLWRFVTAILASALPFLTVIRAIDFLVDVAVHCRSFLELREAALARTTEALGNMWEVVNLLFFWNTHRSLFRAVAFALLLPASGFKGGPHKVRIVLWVVLCALPCALPKPLVGLAVGSAVSLLCFGVAIRQGLGREDGSGTVMADASARLTWMNALAVAAVVVEGLLLTMFSKLRDTLKDDSWVHPSVGIAVVWLLAIALPQAMPAKLRTKCLQSSSYHASVQLLRRLCVIPAATVLFMAVGDESGVTVRERALTLLLLFLGVTVVLGLEQQEVAGMPPELGFDLAQTPLFMAGLGAAQFVLLAALALELPVSLQALAAGLAPVWICGYPVLFGITGGAPWLLPLRLAASLAPCWALVADIMDAKHLYGYSAIVVAVACMAARSMWLARAARRRGPLESGLQDTIVALASKRLILCRAGGEVPAPLRPSLASAVPDAAAYAFALEAFEAKVRIERLDKDFLGRRSDWLRELRTNRQSFAEVARCAKELLAAIRTPPSKVLVIASLRASGGAAGRVPFPIWMEIMGAAGEAPALTQLLRPLTHNFAAGSPSLQLARARKGLKEVIVSLKQIRGETLVRVERLETTTITWALGPRPSVVGQNEVPEPSTLEEELQRMWSVAPKYFGQGCDCGRGRHRRFIFNPCCLQVQLKTYDKCCRRCGRHGRHSAGCEKRSRKHPYEGPRSLLSGTPLTEVPVIIVERRSTKAVTRTSQPDASRTTSQTFLRPVLDDESVEPDWSVPAGGVVTV